MGDASSPRRSGRVSGVARPRLSEFDVHAIHPARRHRTAPDPSGPFPWETAHAAPEDRAVGLELELIELVRRREALADPAGFEGAALDAEIDLVLAELGSVAGLPLAG